MLTREHVCGKCRWGEFGSTDCPGYRPSQTVGYDEDRE